MKFLFETMRFLSKYIALNQQIVYLMTFHTYFTAFQTYAPRRITGVFGRILQNTATGSVAVFFLYVQTASECALCDTSVGKSWANNGAW